MIALFIVGTALEAFWFARTESKRVHGDARPGEVARWFVVLFALLLPLNLGVFFLVAGIGI